MFHAIMGVILLLIIYNHVNLPEFAAAGKKTQPADPFQAFLVLTSLNQTLNRNMHDIILPRNRSQITENQKNPYEKNIMFCPHSVPELKPTNENISTLKLRRIIKFKCQFQVRHPRTKHKSQLKVSKYLQAKEIKKKKKNRKQDKWMCQGKPDEFCVCRLKSLRERLI